MYPCEFFILTTLLASVVALKNSKPSLLNTFTNEPSILIFDFNHNGLCIIVTPVLLLHSKYVSVSPSLAPPETNRIASWSVLKSNDVLDLVELTYLSIFVLASTNLVGLLTPPPPPLTPAINPSTSLLL